MIHFVGAGSGAADLITLRGKNYLEEADVIIYAGSLVNPALLDYRKEGCIVYDSAKMTLEEVIEAMEKAEEKGLMTVRLHTGDPSIYGAIREQMDILDAHGKGYRSCPGVSACFGAAASTDLEYTLPGISQTLIITRLEGRTPVPEKEQIALLAAHHASMAIYLSAGMLEKLSHELIRGGLSENTPALLVYKATWPDEKIVHCTVGSLAQAGEENGISKTAVVLVGDVTGHPAYERSKLYDPSFVTGYRAAKNAGADGKGSEN